MNKIKILACLIISLSFFGTGILAKGGGLKVAECRGTLTDCEETCDAEFEIESTDHSKCTNDCIKDYYKCLFKKQEKGQK